MENLEGSTAIVTGAASGIGLALARALAGAGMNVVLTDVDDRELAVAAKSLDDGSVRIENRRLDVADLADFERVAEWAWDRVGPISVVCNNAGVDGYRGGKLWEAAEADWQWTMGVNFWGVIHGVRTFLPRMIDAGQPGHIVNTASAAALTKPGNMYGVTKHAMFAFTEAVHSQLVAADSPIGITALAPDLVATPFFAKRHRADSGPDAKLELERGSKIRESNNSLLQTHGADPDLVAARAIKAIRNNELYALTHESSKEYVLKRSTDLLGGWP